MNPNELAQKAQSIISAVETVILGKHNVIEIALSVLLSNGHLLIEDIPGVGKTTLAKALSRALGLSFKRIQFTPDLLPTDITGSSIYNQKTGEFEMRPGPVFANIVLADEINRTTPKTQSALLECMEERQVTIDGHSHILPRPFFVIATQNNIELAGTYPLPEAQMDRFAARISIGYPDRNAELGILQAQRHIHPVEYVESVVTNEDFSNATRRPRSPRRRRCAGLHPRYCTCNPGTRLCLTRSQPTGCPQPPSCRSSAYRLSRAYCGSARRCKGVRGGSLIAPLSRSRRPKGARRKW